MSSSRRRSGAVPLPARGRPGGRRREAPGDGGQDARSQASSAQTAGAQTGTPRATGATRSVRARQFATWLERHGQACVGTAGGLVRAPVATALTVAIIGIALALPTGLFVGLSNLRAASGAVELSAAEKGDEASGVQGIGSRIAPHVSLYLAPDVGDDDARALAAELRASVTGARTRVITRAEALAEYRELSGFGASIEALEGKKNPLPAVVVLSLHAPDVTPESVRLLMGQLEARSEVELAQMDLAWLERLNAIVELLRRGVLVVGALFALGVVLIVGNTVRLAVERRREEIEIARLFGATEAFVRRPFLYAGALYGLMGGTLALLLVTAALFALEGPASRLAALYASGFRLGNIAPGPGAALLAGAAVLGVAGAWLSVGARLRAAEPG